MKWLLVLLFSLPGIANAQTEDEFLPQVKLLAMDSNEHAAQRFCKEVMTVAPEYKMAFVDREDVMYSTYLFDSKDFESVKFEFQFYVEDVMMPDSTSKKNRVVRLQRITAELSVMTRIYNYIFNTTHSPENLMAISVHDKPVSYHGRSYNSTIIADDFKGGYWTLSFFRL